MNTQSLSATARPTAGNQQPESRRPVGPPAPSVVLRLQGERGYPAISVLVNTQAAGAMAAADRARLRSLAGEVAARLRTERHPDAVQTLLPELDRLVEEASADATGTSLAIFVNASTSLRLCLPIKVVERAVLDPTFATRDLVRAMHRTPRHAVLVLSERDARLYDGIAGDLRPAVGGAFPLARDRDARGRNPDRPRLRDAEITAFLKTVDTALGAYRTVHPSPLVVVGPAKVLSMFSDLSRNLSRLAGTLTGNMATASLDELGARTGPILESYLLSRQDEALQLLDRRTGEDRTVSGIESAWLAARRERPEMLAVEEGFFIAARLSADGDHLTPATDVDHPDVINDVVDELIETVLHRGGWVALVEDGALAAQDRVALTLRKY